jgi:3-oxoacyl-[acyl-carrier protein] reductase
MKLLENKKALITGGSRGIGRAIAIAYAKQGADVAISDLMVDEDAIDVVKEIESYGVKGKAYASDASSNEASESLINEVVKDFGQIE